jgi:MarR family transcriptional regulator, organic hydroperoxide resistance regulator
MLMKPQFPPAMSHLLIQICRAHRYNAEIALNELGLHTGQEMILFQLWDEEGITPTQIAETLCVEPPTVTKMLQRLEKSGFVERRPDPEDGRISRIYLTSEGKSLQIPVQQVWNRLEAQTINGLSDMEQALLKRLLLQIQGNLASE